MAVGKWSSMSSDTTHIPAISSITSRRLMHTRGIREKPDTQKNSRQHENSFLLRFSLGCLQKLLCAKLLCFHLIRKAETPLLVAKSCPLMNLSPRFVQRSLSVVLLAAVPYLKTIRCCACCSFPIVAITALSNMAVERDAKNAAHFCRPSPLRWATWSAR